MNTLLELKEYTKNLTVLYVEDSSTLLKVVGSFLEKIFKKVYLADNGLQGLESYKLHSQDLVLTDLTMPKMDGYTLIQNLHKINSFVNIIIVSAHTDSNTLLKAIQMGANDFVPKPIDNKLLQNAIFKVVHNLTTVEDKIDKNILNNEDNLLKKLDILSKGKTQLEFINHYRGVPIIHHGYITEVTNNNIIIHAPYIQTLAISYEKFTIIESELISCIIKADFQSINKTNREITLNNIQQIQFSSKDRTLLRVEPNDEFVLVIHKNGKLSESTVQDISLNSISVIVNKSDILYNVSDELELTFGLALHNNKAVSSITTNERFYITGKIFKVNKITEKQLEIVILFELNKSNLNLLEKYIHIREVEIIQEFKNLK